MTRFESIKNMSLEKFYKKYTPTTEQSSIKQFIIEHLKCIDNSKECDGKCDACISKWLSDDIK